MTNKITGLGIDFGTSNTLIAYSIGKEVVVSELEQLIDEDTLGLCKTLPSFAFIENDFLITCGELARKRSAHDPFHSIGSVKSWLCNHLVDRSAAILPWFSEPNSTTEVNNPKRFTPVQIASEIIKKAVSSFEVETRKKSIILDAENIPFVLTIPASFDEIARNLTKQAAEKAGIKNLVFLEEPLSALYSWLFDHKDSWREHLQIGDVILVCDIGGGTTDFTLVGVNEHEGKLKLDRFSVGEHILLGGDNIDLMLSMLLSEKALEEGSPIDEWQQLSSIPILRDVKERALTDYSEDDFEQKNKILHISLPTRGSNLFSGARSFELKTSFFLDAAIRGFFPVLPWEETRNSELSGVSTTGLPYETDPRFTVHLLDFLKQSYKVVVGSDQLKENIQDSLLDHSRKLIRPSKILFNGGVFKSRVLRNRFLNQLEKTFPGSCFSNFLSANYDEGVVRGAAYFSFLKSQGEEIPVQAGISKSLYLGVRENSLSVPGIRPKLKGICIIPKGAKEGSEFSLTSTPLTLNKGTSTEFPIFASKERSEDKPGEIVPDAEKNLTRVHSIIADVPKNEADLSKLTPVTLRVKTTEIGTLEIWMDEKDSDKSHQVEFKIRD
ncbi:MAG TPA: Hsp70 family protein [Oligoflexia bacterium]|nr:Hsp70 family protein [Oligoflexia bacterium]HMP49698.1 Hsp70 family protein [Oligoflexia bacterium]